MEDGVPSSDEEPGMAKILAAAERTGGIEFVAAAEAREGVGA